jgi:hypothetical protein
MFPKFFTLEEARAALPVIKEFLLVANNELEILAEDLIEANARFDRLEKRLTAANIIAVATADRNQSEWSNADETFESEVKRSGSLHHCPHEEDEERFQDAAKSLADLQNNYLIRLNYWLDKINEQGVILRDLRTGLLDFPAREGSLEYFLCWRLSDADITTWHLTSDGFAGRKPLSVLIEYT